MSNIGTCSCGPGSSINNYGLANCLKGLDVPEDVIFLDLDKVDGTSNGIDLVNDTLNQAFFDGKFEAADARERWLLIKDVEDFQSTPADANTFTFPSGRIIKLSDGIRQVVMTFPIADPYKLKAKLDTMGCRSIAVMYKDRSGSLVGQLSGDDFIGRKIVDGSLDVKAYDKTDTEAARVEVSFQYARSAADADVDFIEEASMGGYSLDSVTPLLDANIEFVSATTAAVTFKVFADWGGALSRVPIGGLADAPSLEIYNVTDDTVETLSSFTESTAGTYVATYSVAVDSSDVIEVRGIGEDYIQLGNDLKRLIGETITTA